MKAIELTKFKPNKRSIARDMWGSVAGSIKTTSPPQGKLLSLFISRRVCLQS